MKKTMLGVLILAISTFKIFGQIPAKSIPEFRLFKRTGKAFTKQDLPVGKMLFFFFFDPECDHCQRAMSEFGKKYKSFSSTSVCLVSVDSWKKMDDFMKTYGNQVRQQKNVILLRDSLNQFITKFQPRRYPAMFLYSAHGDIMDYEDTPEAVFRFVRLFDTSPSSIKK
jgi:peroxiredoxin